MINKETLEAVGLVFMFLYPAILFTVTSVILNKRIKAVKDDLWINQFEVKDILKDIKANTVRNRELLIGDEVYDVNETK